MNVHTWKRRGAKSMKTQQKYLDLVAQLTETGSDYAIGKILGISRSRVSNYRRGERWMDDEMCTRVGLALGINPFKVIAEINAEKAKTAEKRKFWKDAASRAAAVLLSAGTAFAALPHLVGVQHYILCKIPRSRLVGALAAFFLAILVHQPPATADTLSRADLQREAAYFALHLVDWGQTLDIADRPDDAYELNPFLPDHPTRAQVNRYFLVSGILHAAVTVALPADWRPAWQYVTIGVQLSTVANNHRIGLRLAF